jgi:hypothetical protein
MHRRVALQQLNATSHTRTPTNFKTVQGTKKHSLRQSETATGPAIGFDYRRSKITDGTYARPRSTDAEQYSQPASTDTVYEDRPASTITVLAEPSLTTPVRGLSTDTHEV